jgi:hypothetical protein
VDASARVQQSASFLPTHPFLNPQKGVTVRAVLLLWLLSHAAIALSQQQTTKKTEAPIKNEELGRNPAENRAEPPQRPALDSGASVKESVANLPSPVDPSEENPSTSEPVEAADHHEHRPGLHLV